MNLLDGDNINMSSFLKNFSLGTDRSSIFVTLCILVQQLRLEKKVDVCTVVRKLRSQRSQFLSTYVSDDFHSLINDGIFINVFQLAGTIRVRL